MRANTRVCGTEILAQRRRRSIALHEPPDSGKIRHIKLRAERLGSLGPFCVWGVIVLDQYVLLAGFIIACLGMVLSPVTRNLGVLNHPYTICMLFVALVAIFAIAMARNV